MASNGNLPRSALSLVDGWAYLAPATAASWVAFANEMQSLGYPRPTITAPDGAYRDIAGQRYWKKYWTDKGLPGNAAMPGHSTHGWGTGVDIFNVYRYPRNVITRVAAKHGFTFNVPSELWHMQHNGMRPAGGPVTPIEPVAETIPKEYEYDMTIFYKPTNNSSPLKDGISRIWAGSRTINGIDYADVWGVADNGEGRRLTRKQWEDVYKLYESRKLVVPIVECTGNQLEQIIYAPRF